MLSFHQLPTKPLKTMKLLDFDRYFIGRHKKNRKIPKIKGHIIAGKLVI